jgi:hypothetical protein
MDPQVTWGELLEAYTGQDWPAAEAAATALINWLDSGGFPPQTISGRTFADTWNQAIAYAACRLAISEARWIEVASEQGS